MRVLCRCLPLVLLWAAVVHAGSAYDHLVPMRDGVRLATTVYTPDGNGPWPVILARTPYDKEGFREGHAAYTANGFAFVAQDVRGKYGSEGPYEPFATDREDGYDTIAWIMAQAFCDGNIGMTGGSALGITANLAASTNPPGLKAAFVVVAPASQLTQSTFTNGAFRYAQVGQWMEKNGAGDQVAAIMAEPVLNDR
ncbi:MAG: CocE/NonD family hydrolase [Candidatus Hydrogenedentes bacterium]|nr:CocE/NonD family hydrolase [Candidatus Hydrogenedentota bacterium]